jgi:hypothetical protein
MRQWLQVKDSSHEYDYIQHLVYHLHCKTYSTHSTPSISGSITESDTSHAVTPGEKGPYYAQGIMYLSGMICTGYNFKSIS